MKERVARLRQQSLDARPGISAERALLMTEFCRDAGFMSAPMLRRWGDSTWQSSKRMLLSSNTEVSAISAAFEPLVSALNMDSPKNTLPIARP